MNQPTHTNSPKPVAETAVLLSCALRTAGDERQEKATALAGKRIR
jgi:hypothetical protein